MFYKGRSMNPTFGDFGALKVIPYEGKKIRCGDVVIFIPPGRNDEVAHRVKYIGPCGIRTKGDNNRTVDPWVLTPADIIGRVAFKQNRGSQNRVWGGRAGLVYADFLLPASRSLTAFFAPAYRWLADKQIASCLASRFMRLRLVSFNGPGGRRQFLFSGKNLIGCLTRDGKWRLKRPYKIFIAKSYL